MQGAGYNSTSKDPILYEYDLTGNVANPTRGDKIIGRQHVYPRIDSM